jgi:LPXTG-site transpeptidase (sortase) family protein
MKLFSRKHIIIGVVVGSAAAGVLVYSLTNPSIWKKKSIAAPTTEKISSPSAVRNPTAPPTSVNIIKIKKDLPIKPATVRGNDWDMFGDAVAWLSTSATPGKGNVILYAHDWVNLWADLYLLKPGDLIEVRQGDIVHTYEVTQSKAVDQHDVKSILSDENRLTLYTCEGSFDEKRRVVYAKYKS